MHADSVAARQIDDLGRHNPRHIGNVTLVGDICSQWRCRGGRRKISKYTGVRLRYDFVAITVETLGPINEDGSNFLREIGKRLTTISGDPRETSFLLQRISVTLQRYNAVAFRGSFQEGSGIND